MTTQQQAREYYFSGSMTQKEIARAVGVDEKTIYRWIKKEAWDKLKHAAQTMPAIISDNFCSQLVEMQNYIAGREEGRRFPTIQEAETMRKLVLCITRMKDTPSLGTNMEMMMSFSTYVDHADHELTQKIVRYADTYFKSKARLGSMPYQFAYGIPTPRPTQEELNEINEELNDLKEETRESSIEKSVTQSAVESSIEKSVTQSTVESSIETSVIQGCHLERQSKDEGQHISGKSTEPKSGIEYNLNNKEQSHSATQEKAAQESPCPSPGTTGHCSGIKSTSPSFGEISIPPYGVIWLGAAKVYDSQTNNMREIKNGELDWLYRNGYIKR